MCFYPCFAITPFDLDSAENLDDKYIHLTNHCIAATHTDYGKYEATNEMFYKEFSVYLEQQFADRADVDTAAGQTVLGEVILPQFKHIVTQSLQVRHRDAR